MRILTIGLLVTAVSWEMSSALGWDLSDFNEGLAKRARFRRSPIALSYDIHQQFESGLGPHEHAITLTHTVSHGLQHHGITTTAGHGLLQTHPPPALHHPHVHHHKVGYGHGYSLGAYKGYGPAHSVLNLHYGGFGVGLGFGGHGHGHGFFV